MRFEGTQTIATTREQVWAFIMAPDKVGHCAPGFQKVEITDNEHFKAFVGVGVVHEPIAASDSRRDRAPSARPG